MNLKTIFFIVAAVLLYHFITRPVTASARELDPNCDVVIFTTKSCPYCHQARQLLEKSYVAWCDKDIEVSSEDYATFKKLGGRGVPLAVIGEELVFGFQTKIYNDALAKL